MKTNRRWMKSILAVASAAERAQMPWVRTTREATSNDASGKSATRGLSLTANAPRTVALGAR